ncbi:MAG: hypothetical protein A3G80_01870 [Betaproteobacteria bacterium RIFCSPLOWO2_12_FULL_62_13b]|nr:MAG: hypothetical protein A3G80_01870 [Betaproteobacteria bacterium RIFCSPLOWO2_12_FULL_62_13b]
MMLLAVVSSSASAAWVELGSNDYSTYYVDATSIRRDGDTVKMWSLLDFRKARTFEKLPYMSLKAQGEYDCKREQLRVFSGTRQSENMGEGDAVSRISEPSEWSAVAPGGIGQAFWKFACEKR